MNVLISGAGIAGPTLAFWLSEYGFQPTIVERSSQLRTGGYVVDFWGAGYEVADRMGIRRELIERGYFIREVKVVNRSGERVSGFPAEAFARLTDGRFLSIPRGDLAAAIFRRVESRVESMFGDSIKHLKQTESAVEVDFDNGNRRTFDLVIGADGLHSNVRDLVFGKEQRYENYLGYKVAAFEASGYRPRDELAYVMFTEVSQQVARFSMSGDRTMFLFTFADDSLESPKGLTAEKEIVRRRFGGSGWECPRILKALDDADTMYFDRVSQIRMPPDEGLWTRGRVTLVGDAAFCVSLLAGQGSALAMAAAYVLAGELRRANGDYRVAFTRYQETFAPFVLRKQQAALRFAGAFAPRSQFSLFLRNQVMKLLTIPWIADLTFGRDLSDRITLPSY